MGATTDAFDRDYVRADEGAIVDATVDASDALHFAERYTAYVIRNQRKALVVPRVEVLEREVVYKPFSIIGCHRDGPSRFRVLVDGVTGRFQTLSSSSNSSGFA